VSARIDAITSCSPHALWDRYAASTSSTLPRPPLLWFTKASPLVDFDRLAALSAPSPVLAVTHSISHTSGTKAFKAAYRI